MKTRQAMLEEVARIFAVAGRRTMDFHLMNSLVTEAEARLPPRRPFVKAGEEVPPAPTSPHPDRVIKGDALAMPAEQFLGLYAQYLKAQADFGYWKERAFAAEEALLGSRSPLDRTRPCVACGLATRVTTAGCDHCEHEDK
jgi:hypothetical protein